MWKGSLTRMTRRSPRAWSHAATAVIEAWVVRPSPCATTAPSGHAVRHQVALADHRLAGGVAPADAAGDDDQRRQPSRYSASAWSSRARSTGDGRPLYWAAPSTTMASTGRRWSCWLTTSTMTSETV